LLRLQVDYLEATPIGVELELRGMVIELKGKKLSLNLQFQQPGYLLYVGKL